MKKLLSLTLGLLLAVPLAACAGSLSPAPSNNAAAPPPAAPTAAAPAPANKSGGPIKVGIINNPPSESGYREANVKDFESVFSAANGYDVKTFYSLNNDEQLNAAQGFITAGVDYLLISAAATDGWDSTLKSAKDAGIKVLLFDRMINCDPSMYEAAVVSDMASEGAASVAWLKAQNLPKYDVVHIQGVMGSDAQIGRTGALQKEFDAKTMNMVAQQTAEWNADKAKQIVESVINSGKKFNVIAAENDDMAKGAVAALDEKGISHGVDLTTGKPKDVIVMSYDCNKWALRQLQAGNWNYDQQCSPFQASVIDGFIKTLQTGGTIQGLNAKKQIISVEKGFEATKITDNDITTYGLGTDPGPAAK